MGDILMYYYLLDKWNKEVIEITNPTEKDLKVFKSMGIKYYEDFPYEAAGFEDPYAFMEEYKLIKFLPEPESMEMRIEVEE